MKSAVDPPAENHHPSVGDVDRARLIVCERDGGWAVALRRELGRVAGSDTRLYETRSVDECWRLLADYRGSFVVVEVTRANIAALLERMAELEREFPSVRVAAVAGRALCECEPLLREAGAIHFVVSPRRLKPLAEIAQRHLDRVPRPRRGLVEQIWADLPWKQVGSLD